MNSPVGLDNLLKKIFRTFQIINVVMHMQKSSVKDFWEDLINLQPKKSHYTGVIF